MLWDEFLSSIVRHTQRPALQFYPTSVDDAGETWTYGDLGRAVDAASNRLRQICPASTPVCILMQPDGHAIADLMAAWSLDCPAVLIPASLAPEETGPTLDTAGVSVISAPMRGDRGRGSTRVWKSWQPPALESVPVPYLSSDRLCQLTSGSMGPSQLAVRSDGAIQTELGSIVEALHLEPEDKVLCASSLAHSYGLLGGLLAPLRVGACCVLARNPADVHPIQQSDDVTIWFGLAALYRALLVANGPLPSVSARWAFSAGSPLPKGLYAAFLERFGIPIRQDYGTTETGTISLDLASPAEPQTVGTLLPHIEVKMTRPVDVPLEAGEAGEIMVHSPAVARAYRTRDGFQPSTDAEGWYHTRDAGRVLEGRRLQVGRRLRATVRRGNRDLMLDGIERKMQRMPGVDELVVFPKATSEGSALLKAIVASPSLSAEEIRQWMRHLHPWERPDEIDVRTELPRSPAGKILHKYLK